MGAASEAQWGVADAEERAADGTAAVLHGLLTVFSEVVGELDHRMAGIEAALTERDSALAERVDGLQRGLSDRQRDLDRAVAGLGATVEDHRRALEEVDGALRSVAASLDQVVGRVEDRSAQVLSELEGGQALGQSVQHLAALVEGHHVAVTSLRDTVRSVAASTGAMGARIEEALERLEAAQREAAGADGRLEGQVAELRSLLDAHLADAVHAPARRADSGRRAASGGIRATGTGTRRRSARSSAEPAPGEHDQQRP